MSILGSSNCYWVAKGVLVGGSIVDGEDWKALAAKGALAVVNVECEHSDVSKGIPALIERGAPDDGTPRELQAVRDYVSFAREHLKNGAIYVHCAAGCCRGPSAAYAILRGALGMSQADAIAAIRKGQGDDRRCGGHLFGEGSQTVAYASIEAALAGWT